MEEKAHKPTELETGGREQSSSRGGMEILHDNGGSDLLFRDTSPGAGGGQVSAISVTTRGNVITIDLYAVRRCR